MTFNNEVKIKVYLRYNTADDLKKIKFSEIQEQYTGGNYHYVIGTVHLNELIKNKSYILQNNLFVGAIGDEISSSVSTVKKEEKKLVFQ